MSGSMSQHNLSARAAYPETGTHDREFGESDEIQSTHLAEDLQYYSKLAMV